MLELWLIRHGETAVNAQGRILGRADVPLSEEGVRQSRLLGARLAESGPAFDRVYAS